MVTVRLLDKRVVNLELVAVAMTRQLLLLYSSRGPCAALACCAKVTPEAAFWIGTLGQVDIGGSLTDWHLLVVLEHVVADLVGGRVCGAHQRLESARWALLLDLSRCLLLPQICCCIYVWHVDVVYILIVLVLHCWHRQRLRPALSHMWITAVNYSLEIILASFAH